MSLSVAGKFCLLLFITFPTVRYQHEKNSVLDSLKEVVENTGLENAENWKWGTILEIWLAEG